MGGVRRLLPFLLAALAVAAAALAANLFLLGRAGASSDEIGRLSPVQPAVTAPVTTRPPVRTTPKDGEHHDGEHGRREHADGDD